jgi:hypothetical protein
MNGVKRIILATSGPNRGFPTFEDRLVPTPVDPPLIFNGGGVDGAGTAFSRPASPPLKGRGARHSILFFFLLIKKKNGITEKFYHSEHPVLKCPASKSLAKSERTTSK